MRVPHTPSSFQLYVTQSSCMMFFFNCCPSSLLSSSFESWCLLKVEYIFIWWIIHQHHQQIFSCCHSNNKDGDYWQWCDMSVTCDCLHTTTVVGCLVPLSIWQFYQLAAAERLHRVTKSRLTLQNKECTLPYYTTLRMYSN